MPQIREYRFLWILCLIVAPPILVIIELFHPAAFTKSPGMFEYLRTGHSHTDGHHALGYFGPDWWFWLHMIQTPTVCMIAVGLILTASQADSIPGRGLFLAIVSWAARAAIFIFAVYYTALDSIGGIGLGRTIEIVNEFQESGKIGESQLEAVALVLNTTWVDPWVGGVGSWISLTGSWAIFIGAVLTGMTVLLSQAKRHLIWFSGSGVLTILAVLALVVGAWFVQESHACCTGPLGFGLIFVFGALTFWAWISVTPANPPE
ncbi:MAG: hypothetical protein AAF557_04875 [Pseudomonadota bacterium]